MKSIEINRDDLYANPNPALSHIKVTKGETLRMEDNIADMIVNYGGGEIVTRKKDVEVLDTSSQANWSEGGWVGDAVKDLIEKNGRKKLAETCKANELDTDGNKEVLAKRLVDAGITQIF